MGLIVVSYWGEELFGSHNVPLGSGVKGPLGLGVVVSHWGEGVLGLHWCPIGVKGFWVYIEVSHWGEGVLGLH